MNKIIFTFLVALLSVKAMAQTPVVANPYPRTITVTGSAEMEIVPDEIYVVVDLKEYEKKGQGKIALDKIKADFLDACKSIGLPDSLISIAAYDGFNGNPWYSKKNKKTELMSSISYQIKFSNSKKMDELVDKLDDNATQNFQIVRTSHSKIQEYRKQLKIEAVKAAKEKAQYLARAADERIYSAVTITEPTDETAQPPVYRNYAFANAAVSQTRLADGVGIDTDNGVDFRKIKLRFEVSVVFSLGIGQ